MKKGLLLVVVMVFIATTIGVAFAGPFSDVPKKHWAYEAVNSLAAKGLLEGYADGKFKGNKAMTRYEMALLVARLVDKKFGGADLETLQKLTIEFADELALLGVKVQALEEEVKVIRGDVDTLKTDVDTLKKNGFNKFRVTIEDRIRFEENKYKSMNTTFNNVAGAAIVNADGLNNSAFYNRLRMNIKGQVDENVSMFLSLQDTTRHGVGVQNNPANGNNINTFDGTSRSLFLGYIDINKFGGNNVIDNFRMGRFTLTLGKGFIIDNEVDGLVVKKNHRNTNFSLAAFDARNNGSRLATGNMGYAMSNVSNNDGLNAKLFTVDHAWKNVAAGLYYYTESGLCYGSNFLRPNAATAPALGYRSLAFNSLFNDRTLVMPGLTLDGKIGKHVVAFLEYADQSIKDKNYFALGFNTNAAGNANNINDPLSWKAKAFKVGAEWTINNRWDLTGLYQQREKDFQVISLNDDYNDSAFYANASTSNVYDKNANALGFGTGNQDSYNNSKIASVILGYKATNKLHMDVWFEQLKGKDGLTVVNTTPTAATASWARGTGNFDQDAIQLIGTYQYRENTAFKLRYRTVKYKSGDSDYQCLGNASPANYDQVRLDLNVKF